MRDELRIIAYRTHYEIENYDMGDCYKLEKEMSTYDDKIYFKSTYYCYYDNIKRIMYLPKGIDRMTLRMWTGCEISEFREKPNPSVKSVFRMELTPRDSVQKECIRFLLGKGEYRDRTYHASQLILSLVGGGGKTYCAVTAASILEMRAIVICHSDDIRKQWVARIQEYTNLKEKNIKLLDSSEKMNRYLEMDREKIKELSDINFFVTTHSLMNNYMSTYGFDQLNQVFINFGIGIKIIDEFHRNFMNTLMLDYATNIDRSFYLSATPKRTNKDENEIFNKSFGTVYKLMKSAEELGRERSIIAIYDIFRTRPMDIELMNMRIAKQFSIYRYIDYELEKGIILDKVSEWVGWLDKKSDMKGNVTYVISPKKDSCDTIYKRLKNDYPDKKICVHYSDSKVEDISIYDIACVTVKMVGTGNDIPNLKAIINTEPIGSEVNAEQLIRRLERGKDIGDTFYIDVLDRGVKNVWNMYKRRSKLYSEIVKKAFELIR